MAVKAVFFDIDDTLYESKKFAARARHAAVRAMAREGAGASEEKMRAELESAVAKYGSNYPRHFDRVLSRLGVKDWPRYAAAGVIAYHEEKGRMRLVPSARRALEKIRRAGVKLYVASEGVPVKQWDKLVRLGLSGFFDGVFISRKKSPEFFSRALKKAGASPEDSVMVGNRLEKDALPALEAGMKAVLVGRIGRARARRLGKGKRLFFAESVAGLPELLKKIG